MYLNVYLFILLKVVLIYFVIEKKFWKNGWMILEMLGFVRIYILFYDIFVLYFVL